MNIKAYAAELIGTFTLIFIGVSSICLDAYTGGGVGLLGVAVAHGLAVSIAVTNIGHISGGHINPAVTFGFVVTGRMEVKEGLFYIGAQLIGGALGGLAAMICMPDFTQEATSLGTPMLASNVSILQGIAIEMVLTFLLMFAVFATAVDKGGAFPKIAGFAIGLTVCMDILAGGPLTGAAMNPARTFGPALIGGHWADHWVYWVGPMAGATVAALVYKFLFLSGEEAASKS